ncbi:MAG: hypothetical protein H6835_09305 [Planctomycetes bacterium]|nr:hypothetical protein [Planctomycetota bacterium]
MTAERPLADDTSLDAERRQFEIWAGMTPAQKFEAFAQLMAMAQALADAGIRRRYPHADEREVFLRRAARTLDAETMRRCYGWDPRTAS